MIGIHKSPGSFSDRWIEVCEKEKVEFCIVDCLADDVLMQCADLDAVLWHFSNADSRAKLVAMSVIASLELKGIVVFPDLISCLHFDDKLAQKYFLQAVEAPLIQTSIFTDYQEARSWVATATWPKVFKLRCGAGSQNVSLVRSRTQAESVCRRAFNQGYPAVAGYFTDIKSRVRKTTSARAAVEKLFRAPESCLRVLRLRRSLERQRGYVYFQEYMPNNAFDTRVTVIGDRAFAFRRQNRPNDFRASGSGRIDYDPGKIDHRCLAIAFVTAARLRASNLAFDFLMDTQGYPRLCEMSHSYVAEAVYACPGHWDQALAWHEGHQWPQDAILSDVLREVQKYGRNQNPGWAAQPPHENHLHH